MLLLLRQILPRMSDVLGVTSTVKRRVGNAKTHIGVQAIESAGMTLWSIGWEEQLTIYARY